MTIENLQDKIQETQNFINEKGYKAYRLAAHFINKNEEEKANIAYFTSEALKDEKEKIEKARTMVEEALELLHRAEMLCEETKQNAEQIVQSANYALHNA